MNAAAPSSNTAADTHHDVLSATGVSVRFAGLAALQGVDIAVTRGSIVGLVGPNGAGKTTLFGVLSGLRKPDAGTVHLMGTDVTDASTQARARMGLARTFQQPELFRGLTVREHLVLAYRARNAPRRVWRDAFTGGSLRRPSQRENERVDALLDMLQLGDAAHRVAAALPLGTTRLVEVGRALATSPAVMLLDEPVAGLGSREVDRLVQTLRRIVDEEGTAILLVEHDVATVLNLSSRIFVLDFGVMIAAGTPQQIRSDPRVRAAYLGDDERIVEQPGQAQIGQLDQDGVTEVRL